MFIRQLILLVALVATLKSSGQYNPALVYKKLDSIHKLDIDLSDKLKYVQAQAAFFEEQHLQPDSVYALMMHRIGLYNSQNGSYQQAIAYTKKAYDINNSGQAYTSRPYSAKNLYNIGRFYRQLSNYSMALWYFEASIARAVQHPSYIEQYYLSYMDICRIHRIQGNYEEMYNASVLGLSRKDKNYETYIAGLNRMATDALTLLGRYKEAELYLMKAYNWYKNVDKDTLAMLECKLLASDICIGEGRNAVAFTMLQDATKGFEAFDNLLDKTAAYVQMALFLRDQVKDYKGAKIYLDKTIALYKDGNLSDFNAVSAINNIGQTYFLQHDWLKALDYYQQAFMWQTGGVAKDVFQNPGLQYLRTLPNGELTFITLRNKAELLMLLYRKNKQPQYIQASKQSFLLADSLLTDMRNNQSGEESKLYWRNKSRNFFQQALEMCYTANDPKLAFYFLEKSRAVLLNDHLNELGAGKSLPPAILEKEQNLKMTVLEKQLYLQRFSRSDIEYDGAFQDFLNAQNNLQQYIRIIERQNPAYYQYKYADSVPDVGKLQQYLSQNQQQWVQYFVDDTLLFVLEADGNRVQLHRQRVNAFEKKLSDFVNACADKNFQNQHYQAFIQLSSSIYDRMVRNLNLQPGRLIVSPDNAIIPFDALCTNSTKDRMMIEDYAISYSYSARFLLHHFEENSTNSNGFLGMAPVMFPAGMKLSPLPKSKPALESLQPYYANNTLLIEEEASSKAFLNNVSKYAVVNLYTHARGGNNGTEPELFFFDTCIRLSELQKIQRPATRMIILSACETNTGRMASGEGVFSLARGFALAGIPSAVATLWSADETATYYITEQFHKRLSEGIAPDVALQQAKLQWMKAKGKEQQLPVYWADLSFMGSTVTIKLEKAKSKNNLPIAGLIVVALGLGIGVWKMYNKRRNKVT